MAHYQRNCSRRVTYPRRDSESGFDFVRSRIEPRLPIIVSVADGHGSPKCFRSDFGSQVRRQKSGANRR